MSDILKKIVATKHEELVVAKARRSLAAVRAEAEARTDVRGVAAALRPKVAAGPPAVIAEIKN
ncbi:MAG: indole-3-glycerol-phosphate synthase TrpC, partial [Leptothrix sp. (in: b-proteobacteria)]